MKNFLRRLTSRKPAWFWCRKHQRVEERSAACSGKDILGPYPSPEAAADWERQAEQRNEQWSDQEQDWDGEDAEANKA